MIRNSDAAGSPQAADEEAPPRPGAAWLILLAAGVLLAAIGFNAGLAMVNAHLFRISGATVTLVQGAIIGAAIGLGFLRRAPGYWRWALFLWLVVLLWLTLSIFRQDLNLKFLGDAVMIPAFALLGSCLSRRALVRTVLVAQAAMTLVAGWELADPTTYGRVFSVRDYYVATRGFDEASFWSENEDLFLSSERPSGRMFLPNSELHRASSLFLEPVSLGNWVVVIAIMLIAFWGSLGITARIFLIASDAFLLVACDGRFAFTALVLLATILPFIRFAPRLWPLVYLPGVFVGLLLARGFDLLPRGGDDLPSRLRKGIDYLTQLNVPDLVGLASARSVANADSGWAYLIQTQSILGLIMIWAMTALLLPPRNGESRRFVNAAALFLALCMPISNSFVSIKVVAPLYAIYGFLLVMALAPALDARRAPPEMKARPLPARRGSRLATSS